MSLNGIDIASYQAGIDLSVVPCDFVIIKATQGTNYINPDYSRAYNQAIAQGKLVGIYHYATGVGATAEADYFVKYVGSRVNNAILVLDWENGSGVAANTAFNSVSYAKSWLDRVYQLTGVRPLIYMSKSVCNQFSWSSISKDYGLWVAQYANYNRTGYQTNPWTDNSGYGSWSGPVIFQYSSSGLLNGWSGNLDLNVAYMDATTWKKYAQGDNYNGSNNTGNGDEDDMTEQQVIDIINKTKKVYNSVDELPYGADTIQKLVDNKILVGTDDKGSLNLSEDMLRTLIILDRVGSFDK